MGLPSGFDNPPPYIGGLEWVMEAFLYLDDRRQVTVSAGMGGSSVSVSHIPLTELEAYCRMKRINDPQRLEDLLYYVDVLDSDAVARYRAQAGGGGRRTIDDGDEAKEAL